MSEISLDGSTTVGEQPMAFKAEISAGSHVVVVGPNAAGKSSLLRTIGGQLPLRFGELVIAGSAVDAPRRGVFVPPERRGVVLQPQGGGVFPHLDVADNVAFPLRNSRLGRKAARRGVNEILERFGLCELAERRPETLSGGQLARVALARSVAAQPGVLLLDEPAAALDAEARADLRKWLRELDMTLVLVTHEPVDALLVADEIIVVDEGEIVQQVDAASIGARAANTWAANFFGLNIVSGRAEDTRLTATTGATLTLAEPHIGNVHVSFPANAVTIHRDRPSGSARNVWPVTIEALSTEAERVRVRFTGSIEANALITDSAVRDLALRPGSQCWASVKATELSVIPA